MSFAGGENSHLWIAFLRCGFYEVFSDKTKIIFNGYAMIDVQKFNFACFLGSASLSERYMYSNCVT